MTQIAPNKATHYFILRGAHPMMHSIVDAVGKGNNSELGFRSVPLREQRVILDTRNIRGVLKLTEKLSLHIIEAETVATLF